MSKATLLALADELERATEGSRELSDRCLLATGWTHEDSGDPRSSRWRDPGGVPYDYWDDPHARSRSPIPPRPHPTCNAQDAITWMVPKGWVGNLEVGSRIALQGMRCALWNGEFAPNVVEIMSEAATPALALSAASLRATSDEARG